VRLIGSSILFLAAATLLGGCQSAQPTPPVRRAVVTVEPPGKAEAWLSVASEEDAERVRRLDGAWQAALAEARLAGFRKEVAAERELLRPSAALPMPAPTPGSYQCRLVRLGRYTRKTRAYERFKPFFCYVEVADGQLTVVKQTGSQRPAGRLWEDDAATRMIFLGSVALGSEEQPLAYGENHGRDMAGVLERVAPFRWRLVIPWPRGQSKLDVFELTPVPEQPKTA
jgi:hypothetical protein